MNLQSDEPTGNSRILDHRARRTIQPGPDRIADRLHTNVVPIALLKELAASVGKCLGVATQGTGIEPIPSTFVVNPRRPPSISRRLGVDFNLVAMHAFRRNIDRLAKPNNLCLLVKALAPNLDPRIKSRIDLKVIFQNEVAVSSF